MKNYFFCFLLAVAARSAAADGSSAKSFPAASVKAIFVATNRGAITLNVSAAAVSVDVTPPTAPGGACVVAQVLRDGTLTLTARAASGAPGHCASGFSVSAPAGVGITARSGSGTVEFGAFSGPIDVRTKAGDIILHGASGAATLRTDSGNVIGRLGGQNVDVQTNSGNIYLHGLTGSAKARSSSGAVALAWAGAPQVGVIDVRTGSGDFAATFPDDARIKISLKSRSGKTRSEFSDEASASLSLTFRSSSGYATLKKGKPTNDARASNDSPEVFDRADLLRW